MNCSRFRRFRLVLILGFSIAFSAAGCTQTPEGRPAVGNSPVASASSAPPCRLKAVANGFSAHTVAGSDVIEWAAVVENPCDRVAYGVRVGASALDSRGKEIEAHGVFVGDGQDLPTILSKQKLAVAGTIDVEKNDPFTADDVKSLKITTGGDGWANDPAWINEGEFTKLYPHWPRVRAVNVHLGARDEKGYVGIDFDLRADTGRTTVLNDPFGVVVLRDHEGKIISGTRIQLDADVYEHEQTGIWAPAATDPSKTQIYVNQKASGLS